VDFKEFQATPKQKSQTLDQILFERLSNFVFSIVSYQTRSELFEKLLSKAYYTKSNMGYLWSYSGTIDVESVTLDQAMPQK